MLSPAAARVARCTPETRPSPNSSKRCSDSGPSNSRVRPDSRSKRQNGLPLDENECPASADCNDGLIATITTSSFGARMSGSKLDTVASAL